LSKINTFSDSAQGNLTSESLTMLAYFENCLRDSAQGKPYNRKPCHAGAFRELLTAILRRGGFTTESPQRGALLKGFFVFTPF